MIFFFGTRTAHLSSVQNQQAICQNCNTQGSLLMHIYRSHFHIFWIPIFPLGKKGITECQYCKNVLRPREMSPAVKDKFNQVKRESKGPIWQFSGLIILALLIILMIITVSTRVH